MLGRKLKFVLSDLHLGAGRTKHGTSPLEDFSASEEFGAFLKEITYESEEDQRDVELIFNGDLFEFLQVPAVNNFDPTRIYPKETYLDSSEAASIKRLNLIVQGHPEIFNALSDFMHVELPQRRVTIIKGNHDVGLYWPGVKGALREVLGASGARASLLRFADEFVSREKIYVEHGHQRAEKMNGYHDSFDPRSSDNLSQLFYPTGSQFVIDFFNEVEPQWPFVDQIKPITTLIWYALASNFDFACRALACFIRLTPSLVVSDYNSTRSPLASTDRLLIDLEDEQERRKLADLYKTDAAFRQEFHLMIHQYLDDANVDNKGTADFPLPKISSNPIEMGRLNQQQQRSMLHRAVEEITAQERAKVILFGHTHRPIQELLSNGSIYINTGSWVKDFSDVPPETWEDIFAGEQSSAGVPNHLAYARIDYDEADNPHAQLLYFNGKPTDPSQTDGSVSERQVGHFFAEKFQRLFRFLGMNHPYS